MDNNSEAHFAIRKRFFLQIRLQNKGKNYEISKTQKVNT